MSRNSYKLSPSDFGFLWEECKRCFYLKVARGFDRPSQPFPNVFNVIDRQMKACFEGARSENMAPGTPPGIIAYRDEWVQSVPLELPGRGATCFIRGIFDTVVKLDDGGYSVIDFKTTELKPGLARRYSRQLHAYAVALEHAASGNLSAGPVSSLGLLVYSPTAFAKEGAGGAALKGNLTWVEIERDDGAFREFLDGVLGVLESPEPPAPDPKCGMCRYRAEGRRTGW